MDFLSPGRGDIIATGPLGFLCHPPWRICASRDPLSPGAERSAECERAECAGRGQAGVSKTSFYESEYGGR